MKIPKPTLAQTMLMKNAVSNPGLLKAAYAYGNMDAGYTPYGYDDQSFDLESMTDVPAPLPTLPISPVTSMQGQQTPQVATGPAAPPASPPAGSFDDSPYEGNPFKRRRGMNIHDVATAVNVGNAVINTFKGGPPRVNFEKPVARLIDLDTTSIDSAERRALGGINTAQGNVAKATRSAGDIVSSAGMASAAILDLNNQVTAQKIQLENQVDGQNAQILNQTEAMRREVANRETMVNAEQRFQDARLREEAVTTNLQGAFNNQLAKKQEEVLFRQAEVNNKIQAEALKMAVENQAFDSDDYTNYRSSYMQNVMQETAPELGDVNDPSNPLYQDVMSNLDDSFEAWYQPPERAAGQMELLDKQLADLNQPGVENAEKQIEAITKQKEELESSIAQDRETQLKRYTDELMMTTAQAKLAELVREKTDEEKIREAYRSEKGVPKADMSGLLTMLNIR